MGTEAVQHVRKNTPLTYTLEIVTCCRSPETRKGPIEPEKLQTNFSFVPPLQTVRAPDTDRTACLPLSNMSLSQSSLASALAILARGLNLSQHIEDGFETEKITGVVLIDLSAADSQT